MIGLVCSTHDRSTMMSLLRFTILVIFGVVASQNHEVNSEIPYVTQISVEATTLFPPDPRVENEEIRPLLARLETLFLGKIEYLIKDTNRRFLSLENQSAEIHSAVDNIRAELARMPQCPTSPATPVDQNNKNLEVKVENLDKNFQELMDTTRNLSSDVGAIKRNVSSLINVTRSLVDLSSNSEFTQNINEGLQKLTDLQTPTSTSYPLNFTLEKQYARNCREVQKSEEIIFGIYMIQPEHSPKPFKVVCDLFTRGGGWTVIQRRFNGSQDFYLGWEHYKKGFGNLGGEFWLGLENIHLLTGYEENELLIELGHNQYITKSAFYSKFSVGSEMDGYSLKVLGEYFGDAGDSLTYHTGMKFSTKDNDQDSHQYLNCAQNCNGGWWYNNCADSNLNGKYFDHGQVVETCSKRAFWYGFENNDCSLEHIRMLVRPKV